MFNLFKKKSKADILEREYQKLLEEAHQLSKTNRKLSDSKMMEANEVLKQIEDLNNKH